MPKLLIPIQYEETMGGLNQVRPMVLVDEVEQSIDMPILNINPVNDARMGLGKLLRCNQGGVLLTNDISKLTNVEVIVLRAEFPFSGNVSLTFAQPIHFIVSEIVVGVTINNLEYRDSAGTITLKTINPTDIDSYNVKGQYFWTYVSLGIDGNLDVNFYGFY